LEGGSRLCMFIVKHFTTTMERMTEQLNTCCIVYW